MTIRNCGAAFAACLLISACGQTAEEPGQNEATTQSNETASTFPSGMTGALISPGGNDLGTVEASDGPDGVMLRISARGLQPGTHGLQVHSAGQCQGPNFVSAGDRSTEVAELPNVTIESDGLWNETVTVPGAQLADLRDEDGSSLVLHMNPDSPPSDQSGAAGDRIACAVI